MTLLKDDEIVQVLDKQPPLLTKFVKPQNWYVRESLVQPASLDLHVGDILLPEVASDASGGVNKPRERYVLGIGETAVVVTMEVLQMPKDLAAFGFPPTQLSNRAVLMTNPGHVDPGYTGPLRFTLINMGREQFEIRRGDPVVTLLLVRLSGPPTSDYGQRNPGPRATAAGLEEELNLLARDFLSVTKRAKKIAQRAVGRAGVVATLLGVLLPLVVVWLQPNWKEPLNGLETRVEVMEAQSQAVNLNWQEPLNDLRTRLGVIEARSDLAVMTRRLQSLEQFADSVRRR